MHARVLHPAGFHCLQLLLVPIQLFLELAQAKHIFVAHVLAKTFLAFELVVHFAPLLLDSLAFAELIIELVLEEHCAFLDFFHFLRSVLSLLRGHF